MIRLIRLVAILLLLYVASSEAMEAGVPRLLRWNLANCPGSHSAACWASATLLSYWWLAILPVLAAAALAIDRGFAKRAAG